MKSEGKKKGGKKSKNRQNQQRAKDHNISRVPDRPVITHLTSTLDGSHILAITGHDKAIWVFENDGKGSLNQISKRPELFPNALVMSLSDQTLRLSSLINLEMFTLYLSSMILLSRLLQPLARPNRLINRLPILQLFTRSATCELFKSSKDRWSFLHGLKTTAIPKPKPQTLRSLYCLAMFLC
ncbi:hypothetical protein LB505_009039 [Fusarium chuoi]|nr:hypothetical protein LB505_009039 [Fusarium chuoi]